MLSLILMNLLRNQSSEAIEIVVFLDSYLYMNTCSVFQCQHVKLLSDQHNKVWLFIWLCLFVLSLSMLHRPLSHSLAMQPNQTKPKKNCEICQKNRHHKILRNGSRLLVLTWWLIYWWQNYRKIILFYFISKCSSTLNRWSDYLNNNW